MTTPTPHAHILVGIDGSTSALHALTWAGAEAQRRHQPLTLVHIIDHSSLGQGFNLGAS
ncbi:universal stress protein, partial [Mycolicibacter hiberniae]|uniref:universal stress protein n=1 Tax=Mycolicibacter hiberniae TaxID=29314 RepID=UPI0021F2F266